MGQLTIDRFQCRYRLPASRVHERARIDAVLADLTAGALEDVVDRAGVDPAALICIRRLEVPVALRLGGPDRGMLEAWAAAFSAALDRAIAGGGAQSADDEPVVWFASRHHALVELGVSVARGTVRDRAWAWHQLGMWPAYGPTDRAGQARAFTDAVVREHASPVGLLVALAERQLLSALAAELPPQSWTELAAAAGVPAGPGLQDAATPAPERSARARRTVASSPLAPALSPLVRAAGGEEAIALAGLTLLASEPALALQPRGALQSMIAAAADVLRAPGGDGATRAHPTPPPGDDTPPATITPPAEDLDRSGDAPSGDGDPATPADDEPAEQVHPERPSWHTTNAGLLLTLGVIDELGLPARLAADPRLAGRPFAELLRALATELAPVPADDPAVAAFCGLHRLEALDELALPEDLGDDERATLVAAAAEVHAELRDRLGDHPDAEHELATLHQRTAEILPDPGWIEVRLAHNQTSVAIRRARLDLDPGWLRWLGAVVRFVYA